MTETMNHPLLQNLVAACVGVHDAARPGDCPWQTEICRFTSDFELCDDLIATHGFDGHVSIALE